MILENVCLVYEFTVTYFCNVAGAVLHSKNIEKYLVHDTSPATLQKYVTVN